MKSKALSVAYMGLAVVLTGAAGRDLLESASAHTLDRSNSPPSTVVSSTTAILGELNAIAIEGSCEFYCQDCQNEDLEWTHAWPGGGYEWAGKPACDPEITCSDLKCDLHVDTDEADVEASLLQLVDLLETAGPEVLASAIQASNGLISYHAVRESLQVRRCPDLVVANLPLDSRVAQRLAELI
ncbi:MAG: hypothetical protein RLN75_03230 [Longimicrobiales bacterium]